uniref:MatE protein n=1 Tax=Candidatus Kentrum sp. TUN TaxID=2126343 RepID=A0A451A3I0_9GAMM|nr:MAG: hypothetical protein BECKTUN1418F_GA0071002_12223 [Candidatus Kentron sp. TUN]VFK64231.1 MAG: hypothetical protein BECKTUN1418D_GA0071000_12513 [Candidatus Kentron sp. TUN]VFK69895.1 MAG: hypothetical protein BECKTUN1418E_GA0071001_12193 [Candidatus Kentron sp. TUN]
MSTNYILKSSIPPLSELRALLKIPLPLAFGYLGGVAIVTDNIMLGHLGPDVLGLPGSRFLFVLLY